MPRRHWSALAALLVPLAALPLIAAVPRQTPTPETAASVAPAVAWRSDYARARAAAVAEKKPLLVVFRCLNRLEAAGLDTRDGKPSDPALAALIAARYVPVRVADFKNVDRDAFRFDYDLQYAALVVDGRDGAVLARYGTRDNESATARLSPAGFGRALSRAADAHAARRPDTTVPARAGRTLAADPAFAATRRAKEPCAHCHYAYDTDLAAARRAGTFARALLFRYPLPDTVGVTLDVAENERVASVRPGSPAATAGVRAGDRLRRAGGAAVYSSADLQHALDAVPDPGRLTLVLERGGKPVSLTLTLPRGWRETEDISWRASQGGVPPFLGTWEKPLTTDEKAARGVPADRLALRITHLFSGEKWAATYAGLRVGDVIVAADGVAPPAMDARRFHTWFRLRYAVGDTARLTVIRNGDGGDARVVVPVPCLDMAWQ